jgi:Protein of unknown function (DUF3429)
MGIVARKAFMNSSHSDLMRVLPYAGTLPFIAGALLLLMGVQDIPYLGATRMLVLSYGLLIVSFMAGIHWGQYLAGVRAGVNLLASSNVVALVAWFGFLLLPASWFCLLLVVLFAVVYALDRQIDGGTDYLATRRNVTGIVCLSLVVAAFA